MPRYRQPVSHRGLLTWSPGFSSWLNCVTGLAVNENLLVAQQRLDVVTALVLQRSRGGMA
ncbi:MAG: hypothetical protein MZV63_62395 [Marinilabiliales bacterium]|nr:hypothetical protein [Marinilabiliales bacterium]